MKTSINLNHKEELVLTKAIVNLVDLYGFTGKDLYDITGISESSKTRLHQGKKLLSPKTKEGEMALLLIRVYRSLNALVGNNHSKAKIWLNSFNSYFNKKPFEQMKTLAGLVDVVNYLDAIRGKL